MGHVAVLGEPGLARDLLLAGVIVIPASNPQEVRAAWEALTPETAVVILTPMAHAALGEDHHGPPSVVMPAPEAGVLP